MMPRGKQYAALRSILRCVPDCGDESITASDVAQRLGLSRGSVQKALSRAAQRGLVVRLRVGAYQLAPRSRCP